MSESRNPNPTGADIEAQIKTIREDISTLTMLLNQVAEGTSAEAKQSAIDEAQKLIDRSMRTADDLSAKARRATGSLEDYIKEKPVQSTIIALLIGVLVGSMSRR